MVALCKWSIKQFRNKAYKAKSGEEDPTQEQAQNATVRDYQYTLVIRDYVEHQRKMNTAQRWFKAIFFIMVCSVFVGIVGACLYIMLKIAHKENTEWNDFAVAVASVVSLISVVIVLPGKIAEHLFPNGGDKNITSFIIDMHKADKRKLGDEWRSERSNLPSGETEQEKVAPQG